MKKILCLIAIMLLMAPAAHATVIDAGTVEVAGAATIGYTSTDWELEGGATTDQTMWSVILSSNYYFMDNFGAGLILEYSNQEVDTAENKMTEIGPALVYNFSMNEMVSLPVFGALTYVSNDNSMTDKFSGWGWMVGAGVKYFVSDNISLNGTVDYGQKYLEDGVQLDIKGFDVKGGISVYFGGM
jgi:opacity protein-like surface antigen